MMSTQKLGAVYLVLSSVMILVGFLAQFTSYKLAGFAISLPGYTLFMWERVVNMMVLHDRANIRLMSKELHIVVLVDNVVVLIASILTCVGAISVSISIIMGTYTTSALFVWVGVSGSLVILVAGVVKMVKELGIERPEESLLPVIQGEPK